MGFELSTFFYSQNTHNSLKLPKEEMDATRGCFYHLVSFLFYYYGHQICDYNDFTIGPCTSGALFVFVYLNYLLSFVQMSGASARRDTAGSPRWCASLCASWVWWSISMRQAQSYLVWCVETSFRIIFLDRIDPNRSGRRSIKKSKYFTCLTM